MEERAKWPTNTDIKQAYRPASASGIRQPLSPTSDSMISTSELNTLVPPSGARQAPPAAATVVNHGGVPSEVANFGEAPGAAFGAGTGPTLATSHVPAAPAPAPSTAPVDNSKPLFTSSSGPGYSMTVSMSPEDRKVRKNMAALNAAVANGTASPEQAAKINGLRQKAGYLLGGTDKYQFGRDGRRLPPERGMRASSWTQADQQADDRYHATMNAPRGRYFGPAQLPGEGSDGPRDLRELNIGELFVEGLRRRQINADANRNTTERGQDITTRGQDADLVAAGMRERTAGRQNEILAERNASLIGLEQVQKRAAENELAQSEEVRGLIDQYASEKDAGIRAQLKDRINMLTGRQEKPVQPYFATEDLPMNQGGGQRTVALFAEPNGGVRRVVPQDEGNPQFKVGQIYDTPKGKMKYTGTGFVPA